MTYGQLLDHLTAHIAAGKGYDKMGEFWPKDWKEHAEYEIDHLSNTQLLMMLWEADVLKAPEVST